MSERYEQPGPDSIPLWDALPDPSSARPDGLIVDGGWLDPYPVPTDRPRGAVVVLPGGGYSVRANHEAAPIARRFNQAGLHAFVCHYRVSPNRHPGPLQDAARAVRLVRFHAERWGVNPDRVAVLGFSAGGHLCAHLGVSYAQAVCPRHDAIGALSCRPDAIIPCYAVLDPALHAGSFRNLLGEKATDEQTSAVSPVDLVHLDVPPAFLWSTVDDQTVPVANSLNFASRLADAGVSFEMHLFPHGRHGLGLAEAAPDVRQWPALCADWLIRQDF